MPLLTNSERKVAEAIAAIGYTNPFLPKRIELEMTALGKDFQPFQPFLQYRPACGIQDMFPNSLALRARNDKLVEKLHAKISSGEDTTYRDLEIYESLALFQLYSRYMSNVQEDSPGQFHHRQEADILASYDAFAANYERLFRIPGVQLPAQLDRDIIFAGLFQIERAFFHIFRHIIGASFAAAKLRAAIWQSIFTHDMGRYLRSLYRHMGDITTLITGPSGTGKELVAQAIAYSRFVPFDSKRRTFVGNYVDSFVGLNLTAVAPTLIESELFGHAKGAFTDAKSERHGFLDKARCPQWGTVFLDEIGELDTQIQVKLLRVLQNREFQRVGDSKIQRFVGKIVAATNRNLDEEMTAGRFREDFYYRLCADRIETPSLREQLQESSDDISNFVRFIAVRLLPELPDEVERLTEEVVAWTNMHLGPDYDWPGNIRELEQCVRSILIRGSYIPTERQPPSGGAVTEFLTNVAKGKLSRDDMDRHYFSLVYSRTQNFVEAGRQLGINYRTVKKMVDPDLAERFRGAD